MEEYISRKEHEEFCRRMDSENKRLEDENNRQNKRLELLENNSKQLSVLATSTEKLALSMESMAKEQEAQGKRLEALEGRDGEKWRTVASYIITAVVGAMVCYVTSLIGMQM